MVVTFILVGSKIGKHLQLCGQAHCRVYSSWKQVVPSLVILVQNSNKITKVSVKHNPNNFNYETLGWLHVSASEKPFSGHPCIILSINIQYIWNVSIHGIPRGFTTADTNNMYIIFFPLPMPPHVPYVLRGLPSRLWPKCNRLLRMGRPWGAVTCPDELDGDTRIWSTRNYLKPKFY
jgi:hypothetical protein